MMRNEIGSEFWSIPLSNEKCKILPDDVSWFLSGRSALYAIIEVLLKDKVRSVSLPSWCCDSIIIPFLNNRIKVQFYNVCGKEQRIDNINTDALLIMDFFGYSGFSYVPQGYHGIVIRDVTHSLFSGQYSDAKFYFASARKWCGFWTGGIAWSQEELPNSTSYYTDFVNLRRYSMEDKSKYISGETDSKEYLKSFGKAEELLDTVSTYYKADHRDIECFSYLDDETIKRTRRRNAKMLIEEFGEYCIFDAMSEGDCPLFVPIRVKNRDKMRSFLIRNGIYCPVHWPLTKAHEISKEQSEIYGEELSLVCDQRYDENDMKRLISTVKEAVRGND